MISYKYPRKSAILHLQVILAGGYAQFFFISEWLHITMIERFLKTLHSQHWNQAVVAVRLQHVIVTLNAVYAGRIGIRSVQIQLSFNGKVQDHVCRLVITYAPNATIVSPLMTWDNWDTCPTCCAGETHHTDNGCAHFDKWVLLKLLKADIERSIKDPLLTGTICNPSLLFTKIDKTDYKESKLPFIKARLPPFYL